MTSASVQAEHDYKTAVAMGLTGKDRWSAGISHHPESERLVRFLSQVDAADYSDYFDWRCGGDGDNGETLMYQMDVFFEMMDRLQGQDPPDACA